MKIKEIILLLHQTFETPSISTRILEKSVFCAAKIRKILLNRNNNIFF